jgi:hypothetical protein
MDADAITHYITNTFDGLNVVTADGNTFFRYDPEGKLPSERQMPFATLVTNDSYDQVSNLNRPSIFRLNIGVSKETYRALFGPQPPPPGADGVVDTGHDFAVLDQLLPHPVYAPQSWVCVLNPGATTLQTVQSLLVEAYDLAANRYAKRTAREEA